MLIGDEGMNGIVCRECGEPIKEDLSPGVWLHDTDDGHDRDADHVAIPDVEE